MYLGFPLGTHLRVLHSGCLKRCVELLYHSNCNLRLTHHLLNVPLCIKQLSSFFCVKLIISSEQLTCSLSSTKIKNIIHMTKTIKHINKSIRKKIWYSTWVNASSEFVPLIFMVLLIHPHRYSTSTQRMCNVLLEDPTLLVEIF